MKPDTDLQVMTWPWLTMSVFISSQRYLTLHYVTTFPHDCTPVHQARSMQTSLDEVGKEEASLCHKTIDWDELQEIFQAKFFSSKSVLALINTQFCINGREIAQTIHFQSCGHNSERCKGRANGSTLKTMD